MLSSKIDDMGQSFVDRKLRIEYRRPEDLIPDPRNPRKHSRKQIKQMLTTAGFDKIRFSDHEPFWCAIGTKR